jgi:hypothetical protein
MTVNPKHRSPSSGSLVPWVKTPGRIIVGTAGTFDNVRTITSAEEFERLYGYRTDIFDRPPPPPAALVVGKKQKAGGRKR